jgi:hypothetical protein
MMLPRIVPLPIAMVLPLTMAACAGGAVEVNTVPTPTTTAGCIAKTLASAEEICPSLSAVRSNFSSFPLSSPTRKL